MRLQDEKEFYLFLRRNEDKTILIKFFAEWCSPCKELELNLEKVLENRENILLIEIDIEKFPNLVQLPEFNIKSIPTLVIWKKSIGMKNIEQLKKFIDGDPKVGPLV